MLFFAQLNLTTPLKSIFKKIVENPTFRSSWTSHLNFFLNFEVEINTIWFKSINIFFYFKKKLNIDPKLIVHLHLLFA